MPASHLVAFPSGATLRPKGLLGEAQTDRRQLQRAIADGKPPLRPSRVHVLPSINTGSAPQSAWSQPEARDKVLLGAAGIAVIAAFGFAWQRRAAERAWGDLTEAAREMTLSSVGQVKVQEST